MAVGRSLRTTQSLCISVDSRSVFFLLLHLRSQTQEMHLFPQGQCFHLTLIPKGGPGLLGTWRRKHKG